MTNGYDATDYRILVIDDNPAIHEDFEKILAGSDDSEAAMERAERMLFGDSQASLPQASFQIDFASQGQQGVETGQVARPARGAITRSHSWTCACRPVGTGWKQSSACGLWTRTCRSSCAPRTRTTTGRISSSGSALTDKLLVLKKPFEPIEVLQCAQRADTQVARRAGCCAVRSNLSST